MKLDDEEALKSFVLFHPIYMLTHYYDIKALEYIFYSCL